MTAPADTDTGPDTDTDTGSGTSGDAGGHSRGRIGRVMLSGNAPARLTPMLEADHAQALADLEADNSFALLGRAGAENAGPFVLHLCVQEGRLVLDVRDAQDVALHSFGLALGPFRRLMKDYALLVDSYAMAVQEGREQRIQAIDMGRRGLHNEGAALLRSRLAGRIAMDFDTARRLFTLLCVLHQRG